ncbi:hypothetical protein AB0D34_43240 [Streptomyces sp. NPDC048420]|uniref:hypothetical protein n=1 Tax=Streptomyces sp. NPDC048420 TaxID=3155755 RepID=UPI0034282AAB
MGLRGRRHPDLHATHTSRGGLVVHGDTCLDADGADTATSQKWPRNPDGTVTTTPRLHLDDHLPQLPTGKNTDASIGYPV